VIDPEVKTDEFRYPVIGYAHLRPQIHPYREYQENDKTQKGHINKSNAHIPEVRHVIDDEEQDRGKKKYK
jgi:hypothetical protein